MLFPFPSAPEILSQGGRNFLNDSIRLLLNTLLPLSALLKNWPPPLLFHPQAQCVLYHRLGWSLTSSNYYFLGEPLRLDDSFLQGNLVVPQAYVQGQYGQLLVPMMNVGTDDVTLKPIEGFHLYTLLRW